MLRPLNLSAVRKETLERAAASPRGRAIHCFHDPKDTLQRMVNACLEDTYVRPHKHEKPDKLEICHILKGRAVFLGFDNRGKITQHIFLSARGPVTAIEILPRTWHSFVILSKEAVFFEIIEGKFDPKTHKRFAAWAPVEEEKKAATLFIKKLKKEITRDVFKAD